MWRRLVEGIGGGVGGDGSNNHNNKNNDTKETKILSKEEIHHKRVCQILRYISTMQSNGGLSSYNFVRQLTGEQQQRNHHEPFFRNTQRRLPIGATEDDDDDEDDEDSGSGRVLFTTYDFQKLASILADTYPDSSNDMMIARMPFSFYTSAAVNQRNQRKRNVFGRVKQQTEDSSNASCWMRLTRFMASVEEHPSSNNAHVQLYLQNWATARQKRRNNQAGNNKKQSPFMLTLDQLDNAPPTTNTKVKRFLHKYRTYLLEKRLKRQLEPIYNGLFEWYQQGGGGGQDISMNNMDLIWGLGQATYIDNGRTTIIDGPLLEVRVEVELARDGALLVRPKNHVGVSINQSVLGQLVAFNNTNDNTNSIIRNLKQTIEELDTTDISPGQPSTYASLLKRIAVEISSAGQFASSKTAGTKRLDPGKLVVTDAWCVYASPRPNAVWARDALAFAEKKRIEPYNIPAVASLKQDQGEVENGNHFPRALWALTHGPSALEETSSATKGKAEKDSSTWISDLFQKKNGPSSTTSEGQRDDCSTEGEKHQRPHFPLPTSNAQDQIAELLLKKQYPAVVCEGPPGTGKTHTIANIVCAYLCQGKRVLVTSKGAPALSVLRQRLPECVRELCVDVSMGESSGMRQLQQTVEKLANKVSWTNTERETSRSQQIQDNIDDLENQLKSMDQQLAENADQKRGIIQSLEGQQLFETALSLIENSPWLMRSIATWEDCRLVEFHNQTSSLFIEENDPLNWVFGYPNPPSDALISLAASNAGNVLSMLKNVTQKAMVSMPMVGEHMQQRQESVQEELSHIKIKGVPPKTKADWNLVFKTLEHEKAISIFRRDVLEPLSGREGWPEDSFLEILHGDGKERIKSEIVQTLASAVKVKTLCSDLDIEDHIQQAMKMREIESRRVSLTSRMQQLAEDLVACRVVAELTRNFSADAQSALVKFAQVSGKAKFGKSSQPSKMTQRQRRKRQEYLDAFEKCVRYIPCWILTSSQISDYLPPECLFDLVVIDEASQSDVTVLPGMLRGKQWLIVGDGKQVSPTESFVSEEQIELLKAAAPESPFEASMLPGHSFFDLCAEAFPKGRVILREHFRCAPEIIDYSNAEFYNDNLTPLRLPNSTERMTPSLMDVRVPNGRKTGKVNEGECDEIVRMIKRYVESCALVRKRTIGVISFVGDEQSRLIRGRLLDQIGPHKFKLHDILVGEPPSFQGAERDIVFLSLVSSPGHVVTQTQNMHAQRANVALSRARDRMVLVRSLDTNHIPNPSDIQFTILDFFERAASKTADALPSESGDVASTSAPGALSQFQGDVHKLLKDLLFERRFTTRSMGVIWENGIAVEDSADSNARVAICVEAWGESMDDWRGIVQQQRSIERVGWKCLRVDAVSLLTNHDQVMDKIESYLSDSGVFPSPAPAPPPVEDPAVGVAPNVAQEGAALGDDDGAASDSNEDDNENGAEAAAAHRGDNDSVEIVTISDGEDSVSGADMKASATNTSSLGGSLNDVESECLGNGETASDYGNLANLDFLRGANDSFGSRPPVAGARQRKRREEANDSDDDSVDEEQSSFSDMNAQPVAPVARAPSRRSDTKRSRRTYLESEEEEDHSISESDAQPITRGASYRSNNKRGRRTNTELEADKKSVSESNVQPIATVPAACSASRHSDSKRSKRTNLELEEESEAERPEQHSSRANVARACPRSEKRVRGHSDTVARATRGGLGSRDNSNGRQEDEDLDVKQRALSESEKQTFQNEDMSETSSSDEGSDRQDASASVAQSRASKSSKRRRTRLDKYSRDGRYYHNRSEQQDDVSYEEYIEEVQPEANKNDGVEAAQEENEDLKESEEIDSDSPYDEA